LANSSIAEILKEHGKIDNLVTFAGFAEIFEAINYPIGRTGKLWGTNVDGTYLFAVDVAEHLIERKAPRNVVFIGNMSWGIVGIPQPQVSYNASKQ
jgi:NAD(P)-dependent dehydrogenase (short-subunit alcohol dehydrogenase family)